LDAAGLKKQIAARKGKVVVVNFWATWCGPRVTRNAFLKKQGVNIKTCLPGLPPPESREHTSSTGAANRSIDLMR
jgi:hypothetical protein